jgi:anti-sigma B factor antagonist
VTRESDQPLVISTAAHSEQIFVVSLRGDLDLATAGDLLPTLTGLLDRGKISVIIDVSGLEFIDSSGLNALAVGARTLKANGAAIAVAAPPEQIARVFEVVRLADYVDVDGSVAEAVRRAEAVAAADGDPA